MKPHFTDLPVEMQQTFGDGCTFVPDFIFTANCRQHDFNYVRGKGLRDKLKADWDMFTHMWYDSHLWWHYIATTLYWLGLTLLPFSYFFFHWRENYRTLDDIISYQQTN